MRERNPVVGWLLRLFCPGRLCCFHCRYPMGYVEEHWTRYDPCMSACALCEKCWASLTPDERAPYYAELVQWWHPLKRHEDLEKILAAVREGG